MSINLNITLDRKAKQNIKGHILDRFTMNKHGFYLCDNKFWILNKKLHHNILIFININITKRQLLIVIINDDFTQSYYDFMQNYDYEKYGHIVRNNIEDIMQDLIDVGIITGYKRNDYI